MKQQIALKQQGRRRGKTFVPKYTIGQGKGTRAIKHTKQAKRG